MVEITQDDIDMEFEFSYRGYMIPPVFADKGKVRVSTQDVGFTADLGVETGELGKPEVIINQLQIEWDPEKVNL